MLFQDKINQVLASKAVVTMTVVSKDIITYLSNDKIHNTSEEQLTKLLKESDLISMEIWESNKPQTIQYIL